jgi:peptidyl-prolyl cis-trans isomerase C
MRTTRYPAAALLAVLTCAALPIAARADSAAPAAPATPAPAAAAPGTPAPAGAAPAAAVAPPMPKPETVVARVNGTDIHFSDVQDAIATLPEEYRSLPPQMLFPMLIDQLIDRKAVVLLAHKDGLDTDPAVLKQIARATDAALQNALFAKDIGPLISEPAIKARYDATVAGKPGEEEVHARHILVATEDEAKKIIEELNNKGDFAALAKAHSTDSGAAQGGDLGWFKKGDMVPEFSAAAFALKPGEYTKTPVHSQYGWHIIKLEERRMSSPPTFEQSHDQIRQEIIQEGVKKVVAEAKDGLMIQKFNLDGSEQKPAAAAAAPAAGAAPATPPAK